MKVLVTCPPMLRQIEQLADEIERRGWEVTTPDVVQTLTEAELCDLLPAHDGWIIGDDPANAAVIAAASAGRLRAAVKWGAGTDNVDFAAFEAAGVPVTNTPGMFGNEVADIALGYLIGLARHTFEIHQGVLNGEWLKPTGTSLADKTVALVGYGFIGQQLARRLRVCGMNVQVYDPIVSSEAVAAEDGLTLQRWPENLGTCDFICFTCALTESNRHMLNAESLAATRQGVRIVNVARGPLIDEGGLVDALKSGQVGAAALDVFEDEPLAADNPLRAFPQNVFGSHNASNTLDAVMRTSLTAIELLAERLP